MFGQATGTFCLFCKKSYHPTKGVDNCFTFSNRSTQTILSVSELKDEDLCQVSDSVCRNNKTTFFQNKKRPVARKLAMDSVIDELKNKFRVNCYEHFDIVDFDHDKNEKSSEDDSILNFIYQMPSVFQHPQSISGTDFSSEETATLTSSWLTEKSTNEKLVVDLDGVGSHIGNDFEGYESMSEKPLSPENFSENLDSFILSDLLSNFHLNDDKDSTSNSDVYVSHHTNSTRKAILVKNKFIDVSECDYTILFKMNKSVHDSILNMNFTDTEHSTSCEESHVYQGDCSQTCEENFKNVLGTNIKNYNCYGENEQTLFKKNKNQNKILEKNDDIKTQHNLIGTQNVDLNKVRDTVCIKKVKLVNECRDYFKVDTFQNEMEKNRQENNKNCIGIDTLGQSKIWNIGIEDHCGNNEVQSDSKVIQHEKADVQIEKILYPEENNLENLKNTFCSGSCNNKNYINNHLSLMIDGKDLYNFYKEFDPNEIFQADPDNTSMKAHYDNLSVNECNIGDSILINILEEDAVSLSVSNNSPLLVNENIFTGKKYLMNRYLSGNESQDNFIQIGEPDGKSKKNCSSNNSVKSVKCKNEKNKIIEICCGISEDSAIFSEATMKANVKHLGILDANKITDWSLSDNSKGGFSVDSSGSSGIKLSSTSDDDVLNRPAISSMDEFLIKETVCNICPDSDENSLCNTRLSYPLSFGQSYFFPNSSLKRTKSLPNICLYDCTSLLNNVKQRLNYSSLKMPNKSTVCSYYTLVVGLDRYLSLPDLSNNVNSSPRAICVKSAGTNSSSSSLNRSDGKNGLDDRSVYISDDYICPYSDSDYNVCSNTLHFLNENNYPSCYQNEECISSDKTQSETYAENNTDVNKMCASYPSEIVKENIRENDDLSKCHFNSDVCHSTQASCLSSKNNFHSSNSTTPENSEYNKVIKTQIFKDCLKCFTISMEESVDNLFPNEHRRNKIINALKKKFSKHSCQFYNLKRPQKFNRSKQKKYFNKRNSNQRYGNLKKFEEDPGITLNYLHNSCVLPVPSNNVMVVAESKVDKSTDQQANLLSSMSYTCLSDNECYRVETTNDSKGGNSNVNFNSFLNGNESVMFSDFLCTADDDEDDDLEQEEFVGQTEGVLSSSSSKEKMMISAYSDSYFSVPSSSISSETETYYSLGHYESSINSRRSSFNDIDFKSKHINKIHSNYERISDMVQIGHNSTFIIRDIDHKDYNNSYIEINNSDDDIDSYLNEIAVNVSSVSCQTDESLQDHEILEYRPEDFSENTNQYRDSCETSNIPKRDGIYENSSHQLYTIYETSCELSPEY